MSDADVAAVAAEAKVPEIELHPELVRVVTTQHNEPGFLVIFISFMISFVSPLLFFILQRLGPKKRCQCVDTKVIFCVMFLYIERVVYKYFLVAFKVNYYLAISSLMLFTFYTIFIANPDDVDKGITGFQDWMLYIFICALFFGVINRDFAEICAEMMAIKFGYHPGQLPSSAHKANTCGICNQYLLDASASFQTFEKTIELSCGHTFHDFCIRGWCMIGKKNMCAYCHEKVDLSTTFDRPWDQVDLMYGTFLDTFRYFTGWLPAMIIFWRANIKLFHLNYN
ncbi:MAG: hypothetical protein MHPSP_000513 [Paramarteilia canceri]